MIWLLLLIDILIYKYTVLKTCLILSAIPFIKRNEFSKIISVGLLLDYLIFNNKFPRNTITILILFLLNKLFIKEKNLTLQEYILLMITNIIIFHLINSLFATKFYFLSFALAIFKLLLSNALFWYFCYKINHINIKFK